MAKGDPTFTGMSDLMTQSFEQTRKGMENYLDLFKINMTASPLFTSSDITKKMQSYGDQNIAIATQFAKKLSQAKDFQDFWRIQTEFMQAQWKVFSEQTKDLGETITKSATGALKGSSS
ncbi:MAG TPA: phasin family protein [Pseudolabrys sp.]|nr:phasin family protein [Pseudolabrys sp.]